MKIRNISDSSIKRSIRLDARNRNMRRKMLATGKFKHKRASEEQLFLARICIKLDTDSIKFLMSLNS